MPVHYRLTSTGFVGYHNVKSVTATATARTRHDDIAGDDIAAQVFARNIIFYQVQQSAAALQPVLLRPRVPLRVCLLRYSHRKTCFLPKSGVPQ